MNSDFFSSFKRKGNKSGTRAHGIQKETKENLNNNNIFVGITS